MIRFGSGDEVLDRQCGGEVLWSTVEGMWSGQGPGQLYVSVAQQSRLCSHQSTAASAARGSSTDTSMASGRAAERMAAGLKWVRVDMVDAEGSLYGGAG